MRLLLMVQLSRQPSSLETNPKMLKICCCWMSLLFPLAWRLLVKSWLSSSSATAPFLPNTHRPSLPSLTTSLVSIPWRRMTTSLASLDSQAYLMHLVVFLRLKSLLISMPMASLMSLLWIRVQEKRTRSPSLTTKVSYNTSVLMSSGLVLCFWSQWLHVPNVLAVLSPWGFQSRDDM